MKHTIIVSALVCGAMLSAQSASGIVSKPHAPRPTSHVTVYDRDSKDPNVGWHWEGGMRVCTQDCENPEIPGSGYTCKDVDILGSIWRECDK